MIVRKNNALSLFLLAAAGFAAVLVLSGCFSFGSAISGAMVKQNEPAASSNTAEPAPADQPQAQPQPKSSGAVMAYKYQFNSFYGAMWNFGWFGYKDANYKPGQGTVWQITGSRGSKDVMTFERAFLKVTADNSQWWRFRIKGEKKEKDEILYEFLVGSETVVQKVRFKDPDSGQVQEFVPDQSGSQPGAAAAQPTREQLASALVGKESVTVQAGTFATEHYRSTDPKSKYTGESWISKTVPGYMVKFIGTNTKNEKTSEWRARADRERGDHGSRLLLEGPVTSKDERASYEARCRHSLETALDRTALYEGWRSFDPGPGADIDTRYRALPILTKDGIRAAFPYGLVPRGLDLDAALARGELSYARTSGTVDEALTNIWNQSWWDASERASWKLNAVASRVATGTHPEAILASAISVGPRSEAGAFDRDRRTLGRLLFLNEYGRTEEWPEGHEKRILQEIADFQPAVLEANPSLLARLSRYAARTGTPAWQPPLITFTYEFTSALHLRDIRQVYGSPLASSYGATEAGYVFMECEHGRLHQNSDFCRVDLVPFDGSDAAPPGIGKIIVTTFGNEWSPLVRFLIGDIGRLAERPCPCGRSFGMTLSAIEGRLKSLCVAGDGRLVTHRELDLALARVHGLEQYRLYQETRGKALLAVIAEPGAEARVRRDAAETVHEVLGPAVRLTVNAVREIGPERSGKFLLVSRAFPLESACA